MTAHLITEEMNLPTDNAVAAEIARYERVRIGADVVAAPVSRATLAKRRPRSWHEPFDGLPQNLYLADVEGTVVFGRKLISPLKLRGELAELTCCRIDAASIIGVHLSDQVHEDGYTVHHVPVTPAEKLWLFSRIAAAPEVEIVYPFAYLHGGRERRSPEAGWSVDEHRADNLGVGEEILRRYTTRYLRSRDVTRATLYDPACSTGQFLADLKREFPATTTIGQDLSPDMVRLAARRLDRAVHGDAIHPAVDDGSVDYMFVRFLNSEVVTTTAAMALFRALAPKLATDGRMVVFGHTPVLLQESFFRQCGFAAEQCSGSSNHSNYVFQYYVLRKDEQ